MCGASPRQRRDNASRRSATDLEETRQAGAPANRTTGPTASMQTRFRVSMRRRRRSTPPRLNACQRKRGGMQHGQQGRCHLSNHSCGKRRLDVAFESTDVFTATYALPAIYVDENCSEGSNLGLIRPEFFQLVPKRSFTDIEQCGGARFIAFGPSERLVDHATFQCVHSLIQRHYACRRRIFHGCRRRHVCVLRVQTRRLALLTLLSLLSGLALLALLAGRGLLLR